MIPENTVSIALDPLVTCLLENHIEQGVTAIIKVKSRPDIVLQPQVWRGLLRKKELLGAIDQCITEQVPPKNDNFLKLTKE